jgi:hypothetical protein
MTGTFKSLANAARKNSQSSLIIGNMNMIDERDDVISDLKYVTPTYQSLLAEGMVLTNQAAFWRRSIHEKVGYLNEDLHYGFDFEWFLRVLQNGRATHVNKTWGGLRMHSETKTSQFQVLFESDYAKILEGRQVSIAKLRVYQLRRLFLMLVKGDLAYIVRGVRRRFS